MSHLSKEWRVVCDEESFPQPDEVSARHIYEHFLAIEGHHPRIEYRSLGPWTVMTEKLVQVKSPEALR